MRVDRFDGGLEIGGESIDNVQGNESPVFAGEVQADF